MYIQKRHTKATHKGERNMKKQEIRKTIRISKEDQARLKYCQEKMQTNLNLRNEEGRVSESDIIRQAINLAYQSIKYGDDAPSFYRMYESIGYEDSEP